VIATTARAEFLAGKYFMKQNYVHDFCIGLMQLQEQKVHLSTAGDPCTPGR